MYMVTVCVVIYYCTLYCVIHTSLVNGSDVVRCFELTQILMRYGDGNTRYPSRIVLLRTVLLHIVLHRIVLLRIV